MKPKIKLTRKIYSAKSMKFVERVALPTYIVLVLVAVILMITSIVNATTTPIVQTTEPTNPSIEKTEEVILPDTKAEVIHAFVKVDLSEEYHAKVEENKRQQKIDEMNKLTNHLGDDVIDINASTTLTRYDLPSKYYGDDLNFSYFQPFMSYKKITDTTSAAYKLVTSQGCYTDDQGLRRFRTTENQFTINGEDDYMIALGTFYKPEGEIGSRYLVVTTEGMYTAITGDEKADKDTDQFNMFGWHGDEKQYAGMIEWIIDEKGMLNERTRIAGTMSVNGPVAASGEILHIYRIN